MPAKLGDELHERHCAVAVHVRMRGEMPVGEGGEGSCGEMADSRNGNVRDSEG